MPGETLERVLVEHIGHALAQPAAASDHDLAVERLVEFGVPVKRYPGGLEPVGGPVEQVEYLLVPQFEPVRNIRLEEGSERGPGRGSHADTHGRVDPASRAELLIAQRPEIRYVSKLARAFRRMRQHDDLERTDAVEAFRRTKPEPDRDVLLPRTLVRVTVRGFASGGPAGFWE